MKYNRFIGKILAVAAAVVMAVGMNSCKDDDAQSDYALYYAMVTDFAPGMSTYVSQKPSYYGPAPSQYAITGVTFEDANTNNANFEINPENGEITVSNTSTLEIGSYKLSVSCVMNGKSKTFRNVFEFVVQSTFPEGLTANPKVVKIPYTGNLYDQKLTAQLEYQGEGITPMGYSVVSEGADHFTITPKGVVSIKQPTATTISLPNPGKYNLSVKMTTFGGSKVYDEVVLFDVWSPSLELKYLSVGKLVAGSASRTKVAPTYLGSPDGLHFAITRVRPSDGGQLSIDPVTGAIIAQAGNTLQIGDVYQLDIEVQNDYDEAPVNFVAACQVEIKDQIIPVGGFAYSDGHDQFREASFTISPDAGLTGDDITFAFVDLPAALNGKLRLDRQTGVISALKKNGIPEGQYTVKVSAINDMSDTAAPDIATFTLNIQPNPNIFTYVRYGNNLNLSPATNYAEQFRYYDAATMAAATLPATSDATTTVVWSVRQIHNAKNVTISETGTLSFAADTYNPGNVTATLTGGSSGCVLVTATTGQGTPAEYSVSVPVFFNYAYFDTSLAANDVTGGVCVTYTPFVHKCSPKEVSTSVAPTYTAKNSGVTVTGIQMDYRRTFSYYNLDGPTDQDGNALHLSGALTNPAPETGKTLLHVLWDTNWSLVATGAVNYGAKSPVSNTVSNKGGALCYVDNTDGNKVRVNQNKWQDNNGFANGVFLGQMTYLYTGNSVTVLNNGSQVFPLWIWFDEKFGTN